MGHAIKKLSDYDFSAPALMRAFFFKRASMDRAPAGQIA